MDVAASCVRTDGGDAVVHEEMVREEAHEEMVREEAHEEMVREEAHEETGRAGAHEEMVRAVVHVGGRGEVHVEDHNEDVVDREDHADDEEVDRGIDHSHWEGRQGVVHGTETTSADGDASVPEKLDRVLREQIKNELAPSFARGPYNPRLHTYQVQLFQIQFRFPCNFPCNVRANYNQVGGMTPLSNNGS